MLPLVNVKRRCIVRKPTTCTRLTTSRITRSGRAKMARLSGRWLLVFVVGTLAVVGVLVGVLAWKLTDDSDDPVIEPLTVHSASIGQSLRLVIRGDTELTVRNQAGAITNVAQLALNASGAVRECRGSEGGVCYEWEGDRRLHVTRQQRDNADVECYDVTWTALACVTQVLQDCYSLQEAYWYGGFEDYNQYWPLNRIQQNMAPYVTGDTWNKQYGNILERLFVSSNGFGIYVYPEVPLYLSFNESGDGRVCVAAKYELYPYFNPTSTPPVLRYQLCQGSDVKALHRHLTSVHVPRPRDIPAEDLFGGAIWSTWAMFKGPVNQTKVLHFAQQIVQSGLPYSQLEIDDNWTPHYGDLDFDLDKFPDPRGMVSQLNSLGFRVTVWLHPFLNLDSSAARHAASKGYLVTAVDSSVPALVSWWRADQAYLLDVTHPGAVQWLLGNTARLQHAYNVSSFKWDAGDGNWLPHVYSTHRPLDGPDQFSKLFVDMAYRSDESVRAQEVRVGVRSQDKPIMFRMLDRQSTWGDQRAIRTVIPCTLTLGLIGYPFVLPDMVGGNGVDGEVGYLDSATYPDPELYVRWLQVNTFLPFVQFSVGPWTYNSSIQAICRRLMDIRRNYTRTIISLARESTRTGAPIVRPLWWVSPRDPVALTTDSQFLLGDDLLVAPVLELGFRSRDVYLPKGTWRDETRGGSYVGPRWLRGYSADLDVLPYFQRV